MRDRLIGTANSLLSDAWFVDSLRDHQVDAAMEINRAFDDGAGCVVLEAPTGSGKTVIAEIVRRCQGWKGAIYMCSSISLQDQFTHDFDYARTIKGRSNYPTLLAPFPEVSAADCEARTKDDPCAFCGWKSACPYEKAKYEALSAEVAVLNSSYFLTEVNGPGRFGGRSVIVDEADMLEPTLMGHVSVEFRGDRWGFDSGPPKVTVAESWRAWLDDAIPHLQTLSAPYRVQNDELRRARWNKRRLEYVAKLRRIRRDLEDSGHSWVYTGRENFISFRPSRVNQWGEGYVWENGNKWLLMSATIIDPAELLDSLGYTGSWRYVTVPSTFPVGNRPVYVHPVADMSRKAGKGEWVKIVEHIHRIRSQYENESMLVHSVSYDLSRFASNALRRMGHTVYSYASAAERNAALDRFKGDRGSILVAPSLERGVDLPEDICRVVVIAKVPFPYLGDRQISARLYSPGGQRWYNTQTVRSIVQMTGRGVRSSTDWAHTYILDKQFGSRLWSSSRLLFPLWWREAVKWEKVSG